ncbi:MAG: ParB-like nuclease domain-containing protein [Myxococcales bacterium]|nr:ParB-like nuclease domain-containing protein [Myxococcales bacterium]
MDLELHQLDRRYEALRTTSRERDSRVVASLARDGQQLPVVVIAATDAGRYILVDGYKRVRGLHKLGQDLVRATCWDLPEPEALLLRRRLMRAAEGGERARAGMAGARAPGAIRAVARRSGPPLRSQPELGESPARPGRDAARSNPAAGARRKAVPARRHETPVAFGARQPRGRHRPGPGPRPAPPEHAADGALVRCVCTRQRDEPRAVAAAPGAASACQRATRRQARRPGARARARRRRRGWHRPARADSESGVGSFSSCCRRSRRACGGLLLARAATSSTWSAPSRRRFPMLDETTRATILTLQQAGHGKRVIARMLGISRNAVRRVIASGATDVPALDRSEKAEPYHDELVQLVHECKGNLVRVHEELAAQGAQLRTRP